MSACVCLSKGWFDTLTPASQWLAMNSRERERTTSRVVRFHRPEPRDKTTAFVRGGVLRDCVGTTQRQEGVFSVSVPSGFLKFFPSRFRSSRCSTPWKIVLADDWNVVLLALLLLID